MKKHFIIYNNLLFVFIFILIKKIKTLNNPFTLPFNYPVTIKTDINTVKIIFRNNIYSLTIGSNLTPLVLSNSNINHYFEGIGQKQESIYSFNVQTSSTTFEIYIYSSSDIYSNKIPSQTLVGTNVCLFSFSSETLTYLFWKSGVNTVSALKYNTNGLFIINKIDFSINIGNTIDCKAFDSNNYIYCIYSTSTDITNNFCYISIFNNGLSSHSQVSLSNKGCVNTYTEKIFNIDETNFYICYIYYTQEIKCMFGNVNSAGNFDIIKESKTILNNCNTNIYDFDKSYLNNVDILVCCNEEKIYIQKFNKNLDLIDDLITFTNSGKRINMITAIHLNSGTLLTYQDSNNNIGEYRILIIPTCSSYSNLVDFYINNYLQIPFTSDNIYNYNYDNVFIVFKTLPTLGKLYNSVSLTSPKTLIEIDELYSINEIYYEAPSTAGTITFNFVAKNSEGFESSSNCIATIKINSCYSTCLTCSSLGNEEFHLCNECAAGYYFLSVSDFTGYEQNCVNNSMYPLNKYLNNVDNKYYKCHSSCGTCSSASVCTSCNHNLSEVLVLYHWKNTDYDECISETDKEPATFLDETNDVYLPCYASCSDCNKGGDENNNNCLENSCATGYYPLSTDKTQCRNEITKPINYYLNINIYEPCSSKCTSCSSYAICLSCNNANGYFEKRDINNIFDGTCINSDEQKLNYINFYFDSTNKAYKECYSSCKTCSAGLDGTNQNCLICNNGYYKFNNNCLNLCPNDYYALDLTQSCIINCPSYTVADRVNKRCKNCLDDNLFLYNNKCISTKPDNTFICNRYFNVLDDCFESCKFCERKGNKTLMYCNECASGYYPLSDNSSQCYPQNTARTLVVDGYLWNEAESKFDKCYDSCKTCSSTDYTDLDHKCITCKDNYELDPYNNNNCILSCKYYWYLNNTAKSVQCTESYVCPDEYPYLVVMTNECATSCGNCYNCATLTYYQYEKNCITVCPENSITDKLLYKCHNLNDSVDVFNTIGNYINSFNPPSNFILYNDSMIFHFCNTTKEGISNCNEISDHLGSTILNLSNCFETLSHIENYKSNAIFYFGILDIFRNDTSASQFEFTILNSSGAILDINYCIKEEIIASKSLKNSLVSQTAMNVYENYGFDLLNYNDNNSFYKNICVLFSTNSSNSHDILLNDRYIYYYKNIEYKFCENICSDISYDIVNQRVNCFCKGKKRYNGYKKEEFLIDPKYKQRYGDKPFQYLKCTELIFTIDIFKKNIGNYFILIIMFIEIILCFIFCLIGKKPLFAHLNKFILNIEVNNQNNNKDLASSNSLNTYSNSDSNSNSELSKRTNSQNSNNSNSNKSSVSKNSSKKTNSNNNSVSKKSNSSFNPPKKRASQILEDIKLEKKNDYNEKKQIGEKYVKTYIMNQNYIDNSYRSDSYNFGNYNSMNNNVQEKNENFRRKSIVPGLNPNIKYTEEDITKLAREAKEEMKLKKFQEEIAKFQQYTFKQLYWFVLRKKHRIVNLIFKKDLYDIFSYKLSLIIFGLSCDIFIITLFFINSHIRKLYHKDQNINFSFEIGIGILTSFIVYLILKIIDLIMEFKTGFQKYEANNEMEEDYKEYFEKLNNMIRNLKLKFIFYFLIIFIFIIGIWYFVTSFCAVYPKTIISWGFCIGIDLFISLTFPFLYYAIAVFLQYKSMENNYFKLFSFSMFLIKI